MLFIIIVICVFDNNDDFIEFDKIEVYVTEIHTNEERENGIRPDTTKLKDQVVGLVDSNLARCIYAFNVT